MEHNTNNAGEVASLRFLWSPRCMTLHDFRFSLFAKLCGVISFIITLCLSFAVHIVQSHSRIIDRACCGNEKLERNETVSWELSVGAFCAVSPRSLCRRLLKESWVGGRMAWRMDIMNVKAYFMRQDDVGVVMVSRSTGRHCAKVRNSVAKVFTHHCFSTYAHIHEYLVQQRFQTYLPTESNNEQSTLSYCQQKNALHSLNFWENWMGANAQFSRYPISKLY